MYPYDVNCRGNWLWSKRGLSVIFEMCSVNLTLLLNKKVCLNKKGEQNHEKSNLCNITYVVNAICTSNIFSIQMHRKQPTSIHTSETLSLKEGMHGFLQCLHFFYSKNIFLHVTFFSAIESKVIQKGHIQRCAGRSKGMFQTVRTL